MITKAKHLKLAKWAAIGVLFLQCGISAEEAGKTEKGAGGREEKHPIGFAGRWVEYWPGVADHDIMNVTLRDGKYEVQASNPKTGPFKVDNVHIEGNILKFTEYPGTNTIQYEVTLKDADACMVVVKGVPEVNAPIVWRRDGGSAAPSPYIIRGAFDCQYRAPGAVIVGGASIWVFHDDGYCIAYGFVNRSTIFLRDGTYELRKGKNSDSYDLVLNTDPPVYGLGTLTLLPKAADGRHPGFSFVQDSQSTEFLSTDKAGFQTALKGVTGMLDFRQTRKNADWKVIDTEGPNEIGEKPKADAKSNAAEPRTTVPDAH